MEIIFDISFGFPIKQHYLSWGIVIYGPGASSWGSQVTLKINGNELNWAQFHKWNQNNWIHNEIYKEKHKHKLINKIIIMWIHSIRTKIYEQTNKSIRLSVKNSLLFRMCVFHPTPCFLMCILFYVSFIWPHVYAFAVHSMVYCRSAFEPGTSGLRASRAQALASGHRAAAVVHIVHCVTPLRASTAVPARVQLCSDEMGVLAAHHMFVNMQAQQLSSLWQTINNQKKLK